LKSCQLLHNCRKTSCTTSQRQLKHKRPFNGPLSGTTRVRRYQKGKTSLDFTETRDSEWQWHQLGHMQVDCTSLQTDNHASTPPQYPTTTRSRPIMELERYGRRTCSKQPRSVDRRRCRQHARPSTSFVGYTIDSPWGKFLNPDFGTKFQNPEGSAVIFEIPECPHNTVSAQEGTSRKLPCRLDTFIRDTD